MSAIYLKTGGTMPLISTVMDVLEKNYPITHLANATIFIRDRDKYPEKSHPGAVYVALDRKKPELYLLDIRWQWYKHLRDCRGSWLTCGIAKWYEVPGYKVSVNFHIAHTLAHEWYHFLEMAGYQGLRPACLSRTEIEKSERGAEKWAWEFMRLYGSQLLSQRDLPKSLRKHTR